MLFSLLKKAVATVGFVSLPVPRITVGKLCPTLTGRYIICNRNHCFAVVNGVVHDWKKSSAKPRSIVKLILKLEKETNETVIRPQA